MTDFRFSLTGGREIARYLAQLTPKLARGPLRRAVTQTVQLINKEAKAVIPVETGALKKSIGTKVKAFRSGLGYYGLVGARKDAKAMPPGSKPKYTRYAIRRSSWSSTKQRISPHKYLHLVEGGTRAHLIGRIRHPGSASHSVLRRAATASQAAARTILIARLREAVRNAKGWADVA